MDERDQVNFTTIEHFNVANSFVQAGGVAQTFKQLLSVIKAAGQLEGFMELLASLVKVFPVTQKMLTLDSDNLHVQPQITQAENATKQLLPLSDKFRREGYQQLFARRTRSRHEIFKRLIRRFPVYSCLGLLPLADEENPGFRLLQAQILLLSVRNPHQNLISHLNLFLAVKDLCELKHRDELLQLPQQILSSRIYYEQLANSPDERLQIIGQLFKEAPQPATIPPASKKKEKSRPKKRIHSPRREPFGGKKPLPKSRKTLLTKAESKKYKSLGGHPDELQAPDDEIAIEIPEDILSGATFRNLCLWAKIEANRRALTNQLFSFGWEELSLYDLSILINYIRGDISLPFEPDADIEIRTALYLSLFLSRSKDELLHLNAFGQSPTPTHGEGVFSDEQGQLFARVHSPGPELSKENRSKEWFPAHPVGTMSHIPLPDICPEITASLRPSQKTSSRLLFLGETTTYQVDKAINELRNMHKCRLSPARISRYMVNEVSRIEGEDLPKAALFFGRDMPLTTTRVHYSIDHLPETEQSYRSLCTQLCDHLGLDPAFKDNAPPVNSKSYTGSPFCPRLDSVQSLVADMLTRLKNLSTMLTDTQTLLDYHNHFTLYTALFTAYASGYRAVTDRFFSTKELDPETGLAVISDKDTPDYYNTRQVWIHPSCQEQLHSYRQHLLALFNRIGLSSPPLFQLFRDQAWPDLICEFFIFPTTTTAKIETLTPTYLKRRLDEDYGFDMPPNSNRHFIKNQLIAHRCPQEIVEAFLGHWHNGQEPWNNLSALHPADYLSELTKHLTPVIKSCGWQYVEGISS